MFYLVDKSRDWSPGYNLSDSPEEVFRRGKGGARIYMVKTYKTLTKDLKEGLKKWRDIMCSWMERLNIVKCSFTILWSIDLKSHKLFCRYRHKVKSLSCVRLFVTPGTVAYQASLSMGFSKQEYWSGLPFPSPRYRQADSKFYTEKQKT